MYQVYGDSPLSIRKGQLVAVDTETRGLKWADGLLGVALAWSNGGVLRSCYLEPGRDHELFQPDGGYIPDQIVNILGGNNELVFHGLPFDYRILFKHFGAAPPLEVHDTMHMAKLVEYQESLALLYLYEKYVGEAPAEWKQVKAKRSQLSRLNQELVYRYATFDARATYKLYKALRGRMCIQESVYCKDMAFSNLVMQMIARGLPVSPEYVMKKRDRCLARMLEIQKVLIRYGVDNPDSSKQVSGYIGSKGNMRWGERTATGQLKVDVESLIPYANDPIVAQIVEYRQLSKAVSSWLDDIWSMSRQDGRLHSILYPFGTRSFRMAAQDINVQAIPMEERSTVFGTRAFGSFMGVFVSDRPDDLLYAIDIRQAEFRLAAMLAKENNIAQAFASGIDPYIQMALDTYDDGSRRQDAKQAALASLYLTGIETFARNNRISIKEAEGILYEFRNKYPRIMRASRYYEHMASEQGYVTLMDGRRRFFGPMEETYKAFNQRVQGSVAVAMWSVMLQIEQEMPGRIVNQIHDSIILYLPKDDEQRGLLATKIQEWVADSIPEQVKAMVSPRIPYVSVVELWQ